MLPAPMVRVAFFLTLWFGLGWATAPRAQTPPAEAVTFAVVIKDGRILPARLEVPAGRKIKLAIKNEGPGPSEFENLSLRVEKVLAPGASSFAFSIKAPYASTLPIWASIRKLSRSLTN